MAHACYVCTFYPVPDGEGVECPHCHRLQYGNTCPRCGKNAPTLIKGFRVVCSACGAERGPLSSGMPVNIAGQTSRIGGALSRGLGWALLFVCIVMLAVGSAAMLGPLVLKILLGIPALGIGVLAGGFSIAALRGGTKLREHGTNAQKSAREQALLAFATHHGGIVTASEAAAAMNVQHAEADAMLTQMAREGTRVSVEVDAQGVVRYVFRDAPRPPMPAEIEAGAKTGVRVATGADQPSSQPAEPTRDQIRERVDREFEQMRTIQDAGKDKSS